ncbi:MAG: metallophosphoesterase [Nocardioides sp.]
MPRPRFVLLSVLVALVTVLAGCQGGSPGPGERQRAVTTGATPGFSFAAAGDLGATRETAASLRLLEASDAEFFVAVGDLDYDQTPTDRAWCRYVKKRLPRKGAGFPFELLVGNHEGDHGPDGRIAHFARCLPDRLDSRGSYARQYAFDYPRTDPIATVINIAPNIPAGGHRYDYRAGTPDRKWLKRQVRHAQAAGRWVIVTAHYPCLSTGTDHPGCSSGHAVHTLLLRLGVDVVVNGHNHVYERSKQLALSAACPRVPSGRYDAACVVDDGADGTYTRGAGTVQVTSGRFGGRESGLDRRAPDAPYFVTLDDSTTGYTTFHVTPDRIDARYVASTGSFQDAFSITR